MGWAAGTPAQEGHAASPCPSLLPGGRNRCGGGQTPRDPRQSLPLPSAVVTVVTTEAKGEIPAPGKRDGPAGSGRAAGRGGGSGGSREAPSRQLLQEAEAVSTGARLHGAAPCPLPGGSLPTCADCRAAPGPQCSALPRAIGSFASLGGGPAGGFGCSCPQPQGGSHPANVGRAPASAPLVPRTQMFRAAQP